ncbi:alanine racemase [Streptomyces sp. NPDC001982]|uniref:alanine racemase n=1 Tax=Streptomyces sp. NPDC001982 TaxID=3154405 RepID=UPI00332EA76F
MNHQRLSKLGEEIIDHRYKGIPLGAEVRLADLGKEGWNVARGDLALPITTLRADALEHNITAMAAYCARNNVLLAPHGKTTMAPQLFQRQFDAGAWGITAATPSQAAIMRDFGAPRILLANELVDAAALRWVAHQLETDPSFEFFCLVDDPASVVLMDNALDGTIGARKLQVLLEAGIKGGRSGVRSDDQALAVARAVAASSHLALAGVETYEGPAAGGADGRDLTGIDALLDWVRRLVVSLAQRELFDTPTITVTAGGSAYFDRVVAKLSGWSEVVAPVQLVLRSGCYISHDAGKYHALSPLDGRRGADEPLFLQDALQAWAMVLSRPEPGLAILGTGKRDIPYDVEPPMPLRAYRRDGSVVELRQLSKIGKVMDQHAFMTLDPEVALAPGDIVTLGLSHPCTAFDKIRLLPIIDQDHNVVDGLLTAF